jgi:polyisoprenoid-binding protein YceI
MRTALIALSFALAATPVVAQMPAPGSMSTSAITAGTYAVDGGHTQVAWTLNHLGFSLYHGLFGNPTGSLTLDPAKPNASTLTISFPIADVATTSSKLNTHLMSADFFDAAKFPNATFTSTKVTASGTSATVVGNLTLKGVTKPVTLAVKFTGAGANPMSKAVTVGFSATGTIKRSDFGINYGVPAVGDQVDLVLTGAFEKK